MVEDTWRTNAISKQTESIAVYNVDKEAEIQAKDRLLELAMNKLSSVQREVIQRSYLDDEGEFYYISCGAKISCDQGRE
ncbi:hypothetical protein D3C74_190670 [compost metagenome]